MIVQGSCALGSFRMQPGPTNRIDAAGALIAPMGDGLGSIASSCESNGIATCTRQSLESTVCLWNAHGLCGAEGACCWARNVAFADISIHRVCLLVQASGSAARWPRARGWLDAYENVAKSKRAPQSMKMRSRATSGHRLRVLRGFEAPDEK